MYAGTIAHQAPDSQNVHPTYSSSPQAQATHNSSSALWYHSSKNPINQVPSQQAAAFLSTSFLKPPMTLQENFQV